MAKITPQKSTLVASLTDLVSKSKSIAVVDYRGLKVSQVTELRKAIKKAGGYMVVTKNTLFKIASGHTDIKLEGTSAFIFGLTDEVSAVKTLADFAKKNQLPTFKMGFLGNQILSANEISQLATIPDKPTLIAQTLGSLNSPLFGLVYNLNWKISQLVRTLDAVRASKAN
jgi:large subunit ribosomal protein L10